MNVQDRHLATKLQNYAGIFASRKVPIVYINIPKAGCTTVKNILYYLDNGRYFDNPLGIHKEMNGLLRWNKKRPQQSYIQLKKRLNERAISFTFVRHPGHRAYSAFCEKIYAVHQYSLPGFRHHLVDSFGIKFDEAGNDGLEQHRSNFRLFLEFVKLNVSGQTTMRREAHWGVQSAMLDECRRKQIPVDFVAKLEHFASAMQYVLDVGGFKGEIDVSKRYNEGVKIPYSYAEIADAAILSLVESIYHRDFERFRFEK